MASPGTGIARRPMTGEEFLSALAKQLIANGLADHLKTNATTN
jgi:hypothetical protein